MDHFNARNIREYHCNAAIHKYGIHNNYETAHDSPEARTKWNSTDLEKIRPEPVVWYPFSPEYSLEDIASVCVTDEGVHVHENESVLSDTKQCTK